MERAKHRVFGSLLWTIIIDAVDKHRHAQDVGQQDELVAPFAAELANGLQKLDSARPFRVGKARFLHRGMDMGYEYLHSLAQPRVCVRPDPCVDQIGRAFFGEQLHRLHPVISGRSRLRLPEARRPRRGRGSGEWHRARSVGGSNKGWSRSYPPRSRSRLGAYRSHAATVAAPQPHPACTTRSRGHHRRAPAAAWPSLPARTEHYRPGRSEEHTSELQSLMRISYA